MVSGCRGWPHCWWMMLLVIEMVLDSGGDGDGSAAIVGESRWLWVVVVGDR